MKSFAQFQATRMQMFLDLSVNASMWRMDALWVLCQAAVLKAFLGALASCPHSWVLTGTLLGSFLGLGSPQLPFPSLWLTPSPALLPASGQA